MICDSCELDTATCKWEDLPVSLCEACKNLLENTALRPDMWFRLARIIGPNHYILHDDFYNEDGYPYAPEVKIDNNEYKKYIIQRGGPYADESDFINDILTRYLVNEEEIIISKSLNPSILFKLAAKEISETDVEEFRYTAYQIMGILPSTDQINKFIHERWEKDKNEYWGAIARCAIRHLPESEALNLIRSSLLKEEWQYPNDCLEVLTGFQSKDAILIFSEVVAHRKLALAQNLGAYLRACNPQWSIIKKFIKSGRPMSLPAIDCLWVEDSPQYNRYFSRRKLTPINVDKTELTEILVEYLKQDSVPRVKKAVISIFEKYNINKDV